MIAEPVVEVSQLEAERESEPEELGWPAAVLAGVELTTVRRRQRPLVVRQHAAGALRLLCVCGNACSP